MYNPEKTSTPEVERKIETRVVLEIMRHAKQESRGKWDKKKRLLKAGREQAFKKGKEVNPSAGVSLVVASPRQRAQETGYRVMLANEGVDSSVKTMEDIENMILAELKVGKKMKIDEKLDFVNDGPIGKFYDEADENGKFFEWAINESDDQAIEYGDEKTQTYKRAAGNIAERVMHYIKVGNTFERIVKKVDENGKHVNVEKYKKFNYQLERYIVTHQGVGELFLAKVLEKKALEAGESNTKERDEFLASLGEGFEYAEGFRIEIINKKTGQEIEVQYNIGKEKKTVRVDEKILKQIIDERNILNATIKNKKNETY